MQIVNKTYVAPDFTPITFELTFNSEDEVRAFFNLMNHDDNVKLFNHGVARGFREQLRLAYKATNKKELSVYDPDVGNGVSYDDFYGPPLRRL